MTQAIRTHTSDGTKVLYDVDFALGYLDRTHVFVYLDSDEPTTQLVYTWINDTQIQLQVPPVNGTVFNIRRITPTTLVNAFADGAILREEELDESFSQSLMIAEESEDGRIAQELTLEALVEDAEEAVEAAEEAAEVAEEAARIAIASAEGATGVPLNGGVWAAGQTFTAYNQYMIHNGIPYAALATTTLPYGPVGTTPDNAFVGVYPINDHNELSNLNEGSGHDAIYRRGVTTAVALASTTASVGDTVYLSDRGNGKFNYVTGAVANGFDVLDHDTLPIQLQLIDSTPINSAHYGITWAIGGSGVDVTDALNYFFSKAVKSTVPQGDYATSSMLTVPAGCDVDLSGSNIYTTLPATTWAMLIQSFDASNRAQAHNFQLINVQTAAVAPPESEWRHGLCLGGSNGIVTNHREQNYSGLSLALGNDTVYGTTCPAVTRCYYWDIGQTNVASMYGVNLYIGIACNDNHFQTFGTFPWNGFNQSPPRPANCIYEIQNLGKANSFGGAINLEAAPSTNKVIFTTDCQNTVGESLFYCEHNASWADDVTSIFAIEEQSAGNVFVARYAGQKKFIVDDGTANQWARLADFYVNAPVENSPRGMVNLLENSDFTNGFVAPWSTFSTGVDSVATTVGGGFISGDSYTEN